MAERLYTDLNKKQISNDNKRPENYPSHRTPYLAPSRDNYQTYPYDYFCGSNCKIFFGDVWVDDIIQIQYTKNQSKTPIYGYAAQRYQAVALGQVIVQGTLAISFKETGYLNVIQSFIERQRGKASASVLGKVNEYKQQIKENKAQYNPKLSSLESVVINADGSPEIIRAGETIENILMKKASSNPVASGFNKAWTGSEDHERDFEDFAELLEDSIWGDSNGKAFSPALKLRSADEFDNLINNNRAIGVKTPRKDSNDYADVLNILLTFGDLNDYRAEHTIIALNDVHFTSQGMIVSPTGDPIAEAYTFFARDINQNLGYSSINIDPIKFKINGNDFVGPSKLDDIRKVEEYLKKQKSSVQFTIRSVSFLEKSGWRVDDKSITFDGFSQTTTVPLIDQIIEFTEQAVNDPANGFMTSRSQYIMEVTIGDAQKITMVLSQTIPNTYTYRVIAPTRTNYMATQALTRQDLWRDVDLVEASEPEGEEKIGIKAANDIPGSVFALDKQAIIEGSELTFEDISQEKFYQVKSDTLDTGPLLPEVYNSSRYKNIEKKEQKIDEQIKEIEEELNNI